MRSREISRSYFVKEYYSAYVIIKILNYRLIFMFFGEELLGGKHHSLEKVARKNQRLPFKKHGRTDYKAPVKNFGSQIMGESVDKIVQKYIINPFFRIKLDIFMRENLNKQLAENYQNSQMSKRNDQQKFTTLRNNIEQTHFSPYQQNQKLLKIKRTIDRLKQK